MKTKRTLILISGILLIIGAVSLFASAILLSTYLGKTLIQIFQVEFEQLRLVGEMSAEMVAAFIDLIQKLIWFLVGYSFAASVADLVIGILLVKRSKATDEVINTKKGLIITSLIISVFTSGLVVAVLLTVTFFIKDKEVKVVKQEDVPYTTTEVTPVTENTVNKKYEAKIRKLQSLRDSGAITKEEYEILLKQVFED